MSTAVTTYCGHCGLPAAQGSHDACIRSLELEPPRYCPKYRRRMVVQVMPDRALLRARPNRRLDVDRRLRSRFLAAFLIVYLWLRSAVWIVNCLWGGVVRWGCCSDCWLR